MITLWAKIKDFPNHRVSNTGLVKRVKHENGRYTFPEKLLKQRTSTDGYRRATLFNGVQSEKYVHRLVATAFVPNPHNLPEVNHNDGDKSNNNDWNLSWTDRVGNMTHAVNTGLAKHKLTLVDAIDIRRLFNDGLTVKEITSRYPVSQQQINNIILNKRWKQ